MSLPLFDEVSLPPNATMVDVNKVPLDYQEGRLSYQAHAMGHFMEDNPEWDGVRDWHDEEGIFVVVGDPCVVADDVLTSGEIIGFVVVMESEHH